MKCVKAPSPDRVFNKSCGNCSGTHRIKDCPFVIVQVSKEKYKEMTEALELKEIVDRIYKRHGICCDCGFCECLRQEELKSETRK